MATKRTIKFQLVSAFLGVAAITATVALLGVYSAGVGENVASEIGDVRLPSVENLLIISEAQTAVDSGENALLSTRITPELRRDVYKRFDDAKARADAAWKVYEPLPQTTEEAAEWREFVPAWDAWWRDHESYVKLAKAYETDPTPAKYVELSDFALITIGVTFSKAESSLNKVVEINSHLAAAASDAADTELARLQVISIVVGVLGVALAIALGLFISSRLNTTLSARILELREGAEQVTSASSQVSTSAQALSQGATEQAASLEETSASMEEMASMTRKNAENSQQAAQLMTEVDQAVGGSNKALGEMTQSMASIRESSNKVSKIIKTIDEIAFQTNILALNAAVEAARAGEAGMGFAVVADEVRNLAQRSAQAAKDTAGLIEESIASSQEGHAKVELVTQSIAGITDSVSKVKGLVSEVSEASRQQATGIDQVAQAVAQMEKVTQSSAATAEESAAASEELNAQAEGTMAVVRELEVLVGGIQTSTGAHHAAARVVGGRPAGTAAKLLKVASKASGKPRPTTSAEDQIPMGDTGTFGKF